ncbi:unnamed protein product [Rhizoctonia solani]|uniref:RING-type domain-containing protein n=1 Tax=Rhizoctonia solani TaxID=456999 RepID=A0A8H3BNI5_9AGAM|nr:unnamed protein product [Rhizoctonia solani]
MGEYTKQEEDNASEGYIVTHAKRCPNTRCRRPIEKINGCDHMTCRRPGGCGHEFCWICLVDYAPILAEGNHKHKPDCRHYVEAHFMLDAQIDEEMHPRTPRSPRCFRRLRSRGIVLVSSPPPIGMEEPACFDAEPPRRHPSRAIERFMVTITETDARVNTLQLSKTRSVPTPSSLLRTEVVSPPRPKASSSRLTTEALSLSTRATTDRDSLEPTRVPRSIRRIMATQLLFGEQAQPPRSELYQPPLLPRPVQPQVPEPSLYCCVTQRCGVAFQEPIIIQDRQTVESPAQDGVTRERLVPEREREERQPSSIPDFESEILLDFVGNR